MNMKNLAIYDKLVNAEEKTDIRNMTVMFNNQKLIQLLDEDLEIFQEREEIETEKSEERADYYNDGCPGDIDPDYCNNCGKFSCQCGENEPEEIEEPEPEIEIED